MENKATTLTIEDPFTGETLNIKDTLAQKQNILQGGSNITIDANNVLFSSGSGSITQEQLDSIAKLDLLNTFTANQVINGDLKVDKVNAVTTTPTLNTYLTSKLYVDNQVALNEKLASANRFTGLQTIVGDLQADHVLVKNITPTLNTQLTSKLYVDTAFNATAQLASANTYTANQTISGNATFTGATTCTNLSADNGSIYTFSADTG
jgi:hypothetical protein